MTGSAVVDYAILYVRAREICSNQAGATAPTTGTTTTTGTATTVTTAASGDAENVIDGASGTTLIAAAPAEPEHPLTAAAKALEGALEGKKSE